MSTLNQNTSKVDKFISSVRSKTYKKRQLPEGKIKQMYKDGMGSKAIATRLKKQSNIEVSYKTIQRLLSGKRGQPA